MDSSSNGLAFVGLTKGHVATVDEADVPRLIGTWSAMVVGNKVYAVRNLRLPGGKRRWLFMHRLIVDAPAGMDVDHRNGDTLDNRRGNLRVATRSQNTANSTTTRARTGHRGTWFDPDRGKFRACIGVRGVKIDLGAYATVQEASAAYEAARVRYFGEFAPGG